MDRLPVELVQKIGRRAEVQDMLALRQAGRHFRDSLAPSPHPLHARLVALFTWMLAFYRRADIYSRRIPVLEMVLSSGETLQAHMLSAEITIFHNGGSKSGEDPEELARLIDPVSNAVDEVNLNVESDHLTYRAPAFELEQRTLLADTVGGSTPKERCLHRIRDLVTAYQDRWRAEIDLILSSGQVKSFCFGRTRTGVGPLPGFLEKMLQRGAELPVAQLRLAGDTFWEEGEEYGMRLPAILVYKSPQWELEDRALLA